MSSVVFVLHSVLQQMEGTCFSPHFTAMSKMPHQNHYEMFNIHQQVQPRYTDVHIYPMKSKYVAYRTVMLEYVI